MNPRELLARFLAHKLKAGQQAGTMGQIAGMLGSDMGGYVQDVRLGLPGDPSWSQHAMLNAQLGEQTQQEYGGWNRDARDVKGYASAADYALRHPGKEDAVRALAAAYQASNMPAAMMHPQTSVGEEMADYRANAAGIQGAGLFPGADPNNPKVQRALYERGRRYAEALQSRRKP
jgi:hypothetical protein